MEHIGVIGLSWRQGGPDALARFTLPSGDADEAARLARLRAAMGCEELVYLCTCNRVELFFTVSDPADMAGMRSRAYEAITGEQPGPGEAERSMRAWAGEGAAEHLFLVATGLDSAKVGETEINGQLRRALDTASSAGLLRTNGGRLESLMEEALRLSRKIRSDSGLAVGKTSLAEIALTKLRERVASTGGAVALVGVSPMTERCAIDLAESGVPLVLVNRSLERAQLLAAKLNNSGSSHRALSLESFLESPPPIEAVLSATGAPCAVIQGAALARIADSAPSGEAMLIVDMAIPPDVPPSEASALGVERIGMDEIIKIAETTRTRRLEEMSGARESVDAALNRFRIRLGDEHVAPFVMALQKRYRKVARQGAERLLSTRLQGLDDNQQQAVLRFAESLAARFAHLPSTGLRGVARVAGAPAVDAFLERADAEMAKEFDRARKDASLASPNEQLDVSTKQQPASTSPTMDANL
jgi:glutamyl-tRNA reductase